MVTPEMWQLEKNRLLREMTRTFPTLSGEHSSNTASYFKEESSLLQLLQNLTHPNFSREDLKHMGICKMQNKE